MTKVRHVLGISGGKDSAALAIYLKNRHPELDLEYYFCDTGKELKETYQLIDNLEVFLGKKILKLRAVRNFPGTPFDYYYKLFNGFLPSSNARWCTKKIKLEPFEEFVGNDPVVSYVGIRGDEDRDGYISRKTNIQSIFPFRQNIWSEDVTGKILSKDNSEFFCSLLENQFIDSPEIERIRAIASREISPAYPKAQKIRDFFSVDIAGFNRVVFDFIKTTQYPLATVDDFPLLNNEDILVREDIFKILEESGVGVPGYYRSIEFSVNGRQGSYSRTRSGCFFCFFQQKIEWVWLYEQHPDLFKEAMAYEKEGFTWNDNESLEELSKSDRIKKIKEEYLDRCEASAEKSNYLLDIISFAEDEGCAACFL